MACFPLDYDKMWINEIDSMLQKQHGLSALVCPDCIRVVFKQLCTDPMGCRNSIKIEYNENGWREKTTLELGGQHV